MKIARLSYQHNNPNPNGSSTFHSLRQTMTANRPYMYVDSHIKIVLYSNCMQMSWLFMH